MSTNDVSNSQAVGVQGDDIVILLPKNRMSKKEALIHAAWLIVLADTDSEFGLIIEQVENS